MDAPEAVLEPPRNSLQVAHATSTSRLSALGLLAPLVRPELSTGVAALRALCTQYQYRIAIEDNRGRRTVVAEVRVHRQTLDVPLCCLWKARLPHRLQRVWDLVCRLL